MIEQRELILNRNAYLNVLVNGRQVGINTLPDGVKFRTEIAKRHNAYLDNICIMDTLLVMLEEPNNGTPEDRVKAVAKGRAFLANLGWTEALLNQLDKIR